ncbi:MAG: pseudouridine synthase [Planctomycetota bacterium]|jgi:pseudouridine synthase
MDTSGKVNIEKQRLHKVLAARGVASRRACEQLIADGRVTVDGEIVRKLGTKVAADADIRVDGRPVAEPRKVYYILNKPKGLVTTLSDEKARKSVGDLIAHLGERVYPVGRLDRDSEGLLLLTNDGRVTNVLTHPRFQVKKSYEVDVRGRLDTDAVEKLRRGIRLSEGKAFAKVKVLRNTRSGTSLLFTIAQGYNRQIRRMLAAVGYKVQRLRRVSFGPLELSRLAPGDVRKLRRREVAALKTAVRKAEAAAARPVRKGKGDSDD